MLTSFQNCFRPSWGPWSHLFHWSRQSKEQSQGWNLQGSLWTVWPQSKSNLTDHSKVWIVGFNKFQLTFRLVGKFLRCQFPATALSPGVAMWLVRPASSKESRSRVCNIESSWISKRFEAVYQSLRKDMLRFCCPINEDFWNDGRLKSKECDIISNLYLFFSFCYSILYFEIIFMKSFKFDSSS